MRWVSWLAILLALAIWLGAVGIPLGFLLSLVLRAENLPFLWDSTLISIAGSTLSQAFWSTLGSAVIGISLGLRVGTILPHRLRKRVQALLSFPFAVPVVVVANAWVFWLGRTGVLSGWLAPFGLQSDWIYSFKAVILAHVFLNAPWVAMMVAEARAQVSRDEVEAGFSLGAGPVEMFLHLIWLKIGWTVLSACTQVFIFCSMSFVLVLILGGGPPVQTLETEIFQRIRFGTLDLPGAAACAFWQLLITLVPGLFLLVLRRKWGLGLGLFSGDGNLLEWEPKIKPGMKKASQKGSDRLISVLVFSGAVFFILPYLPILDVSLFWHLVTGQDRHLVFHSAALSLGIAFASSFFAVLLATGFIMSMRAVVDWPRLQTLLKGMIILPGSISALVLGLSGWLAYEKWLDWTSFPLIAIVAVQTILFCPFVFRTLWPLTQGSLRAWTESALDLGASDFQVIRWVKWPYWRSPVVGVFFGVAGASLSEVAAVSLFSTDRALPLPVLASQWMEQYRFEDAIGVSGLLFLIALGFVLGPLVVSTLIGNFNSHNEGDTVRIK